ncbi:hypothetical protein RJT00_04810 [Segatella copri]|nr:hypothetical protein [Segatella copri]MDV3112686.1 hypothetical protein [Segatella copri]
MEIVHVVAINPYRKGNKGKVFSYNIDTYDKVIESAAVKKMIQQIRGELPIDGVDLNDAQAVKKAQERLKSELPFFCPHYGMFKNNVRRQENALPESFLFQTIIDVDDKEYVEKAIEKARELNCSSGIWNGSLLHLCYSARKKLHIGIRMPIGMTIEETQKAYCEALGVPYDESCITPERMIFLTDKDSEIYRSKMWCAVLPESEIQARRQAFLDRELTVDGRGDAKVNSLQLIAIVKIMKTIDFRAIVAIMLLLLALLFSLPNLVIAIMLMILISGILEAIMALVNWERPVRRI